MTRFRVHTSQQPFEMLHAIPGLSRSSSSAKRRALIDLLMDHSNLLDAVKRVGITVSEHNISKYDDERGLTLSNKEEN
jgi:hypothetical protein